MTNRVEEMRKQAFELTPAEQFRLAFFIAENVGYALTRLGISEDKPHENRSDLHL